MLQIAKIGEQCGVINYIVYEKTNVVMYPSKTVVNQCYLDVQIYEYFDNKLAIVFYPDKDLPLARINEVILFFCNNYDLSNVVEVQIDPGWDDSDPDSITCPMCLYPTYCCICNPND